MMTALVLAVALSAPAATPESEITLPPWSNGELTASLSVRVPEQARTPGRARVTLEIVACGPKTLQVEAIQLEDALDGWKVARAASSWSVSGGRATWSETLHLVQTKPGVIPLPGLTLRLRAGPTANTETVSWPDPLREMRDVSPPIALPEPPPSVWRARLLEAGVVVLFVPMIYLAFLGVRRWRKARQRPLLAHERALARLEEMPEETAGAAVFLDSVLRGYVEERFAVPALRRTNKELLSALADSSALAPEQSAALAELLGWCDVAKFAGVETEEPGEARRKVREFLLSTVTVGEKKTLEQDGKARDSKEAAEGG
jgi:hypothetical protein